MTHRVFSLRRCLAIAYKEALQLRRDRFTFGMIIGIPVVQLLLFGYAINNDPNTFPQPSCRGRRPYSRAAWNPPCALPTTSE